MMNEKRDATATLQHGGLSAIEIGPLEWPKNASAPYQSIGPPMHLLLPLTCL